MQALPCRALGTASPVRSIAVVQGGAVVTGHEDGNVRAWKPDGSGGWHPISKSTLLVSRKCTHGTDFENLQ